MTVAADAGGAFTDVFSPPNYFVSDSASPRPVRAPAPPPRRSRTRKAAPLSPTPLVGTNPYPGDSNNNILNDNKSNYFEGEVIPHVYMYGASNNAQLVNGQSYSFNVTYNWYQQNTDAGGFVYMTQYNLSRRPTVFDWATPAVAPRLTVRSPRHGIIRGASSTRWMPTSRTSAPRPIRALAPRMGTSPSHSPTGGNDQQRLRRDLLRLVRHKAGGVPDQGAGKTNGANA